MTMCVIFINFLEDFLAVRFPEKMMQISTPKQVKEIAPNCNFDF